MARCQADKLKHLGRYARCRLDASSKALKKGRPADFSRCEANLTKKFLVTEAKGGCATTGDLVFHKQITDDYTAERATAITAAGTCPCQSDYALSEPIVGGYANVACDLGDSSSDLFLRVGDDGTIEGEYGVDSTGCFARRGFVGSPPLGSIELAVDPAERLACVSQLYVDCLTAP